MRMGQGVRTGLGHGGITCVLQTQFSSFFSIYAKENNFCKSLYAAMEDLINLLTWQIGVCIDVK